jgi:thioredoxin-related protein
MFKVLIFNTVLFFTLNIQADLIGSTAANFTLINQENESVELKSLRGKYIILEWFNHGCPFVRKHYDSYNMQNTQDYVFRKLKNDVVWLSINSSAKGKQGHLAMPEIAKARLEKESSNATHMLLDPNGIVGRAYEAKTTPQIVIISKEGKVLYNGAIDSIASTNTSDIPKSVNYVKHAVDNIQSGDEIKIKKSKPYGCSVKY